VLPGRSGKPLLATRNYHRSAPITSRRPVHLGDENFRALEPRVRLRERGRSGKRPVNPAPRVPSGASRRPAVPCTFRRPCPLLAGAHSAGLVIRPVVRDVAVGCSRGTRGVAQRLDCCASTQASVRRAPGESSDIVSTHGRRHRTSPGSTDRTQDFSTPARRGKPNVRSPPVRQNPSVPWAPPPSLTATRVVFAR